jgi:hypothetical protein
VARVSITELGRLLAYDAATGILTWRVDRRYGVLAGDEAGYVKKQTGHRFVKIDGIAIPAHHIAWALGTGEWPPEDLDVDHENRIRDANWLDNLRLGTRLQNCANRGLNKNNTSGHTGLRARRGGFEVYLGLGWRKVYLGFFKRWDNAVQAQLLASAIERGAFHPVGRVVSSAI